MKDGFVKLAAACPEIRVGDVEYNLSSCIEEVKRYSALGAKVIVFPELTLTGASCGDMFFGTALTAAAESALIRFADATKDADAVIFIGLPVSLGGFAYNCAAVLSRGKILGLVPSGAGTRHFAKAPSTHRACKLAGAVTQFGREQIFEEENTGLRIAVNVGDDDIAYRMGANLVAILAAEPHGVGAYERQKSFIASDAAKYSSAVIYSNAGTGESTGECVYAGTSVIADPLGNVSLRKPFSRDALTLTVDFGAVNNAARRKKTDKETQTDAPVSSFSLEITETELPEYSKTPFVPEDLAQRRDACFTALEIQAQGLAGRFLRSHSKTMVLGISGGLDSTLALLAMARAADILGAHRSIISAVTMPCFGTTERTKSNAERLAECLGARVSCIDIKKSVTQHFKDIGHSPESYNVVYENAQARERTQVLMDLANAEGGLVVGTGDLSEAALGWATYNGDHMSMYGVNSSIPKTLVRAMVSCYADECENADIAAVLRDILATPVSPELLPPEDGEIAQCTESIVGPYELHDFFIYHFVKEGAAPAKLLRMAKHAFRGSYDEAVIEGWCEVFLRRFASQQFKRSCTPDAPSVGIVSLSPRGAWQMPSDFSPCALTLHKKAR